MKTTVENARNKRHEKKQTNIKWNSRLFFQIGLIASLLLVFFIMQTNFEMRSVAINPKISEGIEEPPTREYEIDVEKPKSVEPVKKMVPKINPIQKPVKATDFFVAPDDSKTIETPVAANDDPVVENPTTPTISDDKPTGPLFMKSVEFVPVFPGCESLGTNAEKVECMSSKINSFINKNFRKELLEDLASNETQRIYVNFKIDSKGYVTDVVASSHNANLKKEAQRVISNLPTMKPGKQGDKNVDVLYTVPIVFKIQ